ncbi:MAG TPA: glycosyl hydrolase family 18 protein [Ignavibacteriaceae bacterium]|nr:glycosyl hydrolase family 18 protein [Ignavibacteriaceae bacterium]
MIQNFTKYFCLIILLLQFVSIAQTREVVAYYPEWGVEHNYYAKNMEEIGSADKVTVLIYAFCEPKTDADGNIIPEFKNAYEAYQQVYNSKMSIDGAADDSTQPLRGQFNQLRKLKARHPALRILISIGGWGGSKYYSDALLTPELREKFVDEVINRYILGNLPEVNNAGGKGVAAGIFDGVDIDWEFPLRGGAEGIHNNKNDKENLTALLALFRKKFDAINPALILTAAIPADKPNVDNYDIKTDQKYLNWINLMTYDYHGSWNDVTAHHTNLLSSPADSTDNGAEHSIDKSVKYFIDSLGVSSYKIIPGAAFYGKYWVDVDSANHGLYQPAKDSSGIFKEGFGNYYNLQNLGSMGYKYYWDTLALAPWFYNSNTKIFWTLDDPKSISLKVHYERAYHLGGIMCWEISGDDSSGTLINTMYTGRMPDIKIVNTVKVKSTPSIEITEPISGDNVSTGSNVIINTSESDSGGNVIKVEYFGDDKYLGYDTKAPFDWAWFNVTKGKHKIAVVTTDSNGNQAISKPVYFMAR